MPDVYWPWLIVPDIKAKVSFKGFSSHFPGAFPSQPPLVTGSRYLKVIYFRPHDLNSVCLSVLPYMEEKKARTQESCARYWATSDRWKWNTLLGSFPNTVEPSIINFSLHVVPSWWEIIRHLIWSLLGLADSDKLGSADQTTLILLWLLYAAFLVMAVILLVNMLIAVLSNVYQGVEVTQLIWAVLKL